MKHLKTTIIVLLLTIVLLPDIRGFEAEAAGQDDYLKVGLKSGSGTVSSCTLKSEEGFLIGTADDREFDEGMPLPAYTTITVTNESGSIVIRDENGTILSSDIGSDGCIMPYDYQDDDNAVLSFEDKPYRGGITFVANSNGTLTVINYISLEHYVYGVLNSELGYTNPIEALKAQAVAARSYGEQNLGKHSSGGFDLCAGTDCQVYKGYSGEYPSIIEAVDETRGEMIRCNGEPVTAFYFKNSGGYTQNSEDVWSDNLPYARSVKDEYSPSYPWSTSLSFDSIQTKLEAAGFQPGSIESLSITGRNDTEAVSELKIVGSTATVYLRKENIRYVLGATIVKSNMFEFADSTSSGGSDGWKISNGSATVNNSSDVYVVNGNGTIKEMDADSVYGSNGTSVVKMGGGSNSVETVTGSTAVFNGRGYGHGVGMPQDSAVEMAKQGFTYQEILEYFFADIEID